LFITARYSHSDRVTVTLTMRPPLVRRTMSHDSIRPKPLVVSNSPTAMLVVMRAPASLSNASRKRA